MSKAFLLVAPPLFHPLHSFSKIEEFGRRFQVLQHVQTRPIHVPIYDSTTGGEHRYRLQGDKL